MINIIGLVGGKGSGKDEVARVLVEDFGYERHSLADPLKDCLKIVFGLTDEELNDRALKEKTLTRWPYKSPRQLMQEVGTDLFRETYPGVWRYAHSHRISELRRVVVADVRFVDEAQYIRDLGGSIVRVIRPDFITTDRHTSETEQLSIVEDFSILNNGNLIDLKNTTRFVLTPNFARNT